MTKFNQNLTLKRSKIKRSQTLPYLAKLLIGASFCLSALLTVNAVNASTTISERIDFSRAMPEENVEDMSVKVLGGSISVNRFYRVMKRSLSEEGYPGVSGDLQGYNGNTILSDNIGFDRSLGVRSDFGTWQFHRRWHDILFIEANGATAGSSSTSDTSTVSASTQSAASGVNLLAGPALIDRNDYIYERKSGENYYVYEHNGNDLRITLTDSGFRWSNREGDWIDYDEEGLALKSGDKNGVSIMLVRQNGFITQYLDHNGNPVVTWEYQNKKPVKATDYNGRSVEYKWSGHDLIEVTTTRGHKWRYGYSDFNDGRSLNSRTDHLMTSKTDPENQVFQYQFERSKGGYESTSAFGSSDLNITLLGDDTPVTVSARSTSGGSSSTTRAATTQAVEPTLMHTAMVYPDGKRMVYQYRYDSASQSYMILSVNSDGVESERWYDLDGQVRYALLAGRVAGTRVRNGRTAVERDAYGHSTVIKYNRFEAVESITYPDGGSVSQKYLPNYNFPTLRTDELGVENKHEYDFKGNRTKSIFGSNTDEPRTVEYEYDPYGQLTKVRNIGDANTPTAEQAYKYDLYGNITEFKDARGNVSEFKDYNSTGQYQTFIDASGKTWTMTFDEFGNRLSSTSPLGLTSRYEYDSLHRLITVTDPENRKSEFKYDSRDNQIESTDNANGKIQYTLRMDGGATTLQDPVGRTTSYRYDRVGRIVEIVDPVGNSTNVHYLKEDEVAGFRPEKIDGPNSSIWLKFDPMSRLTALTQFSVKDDDLSINSTLSYNARGERTSMTDPNGASTHWAYNAFGQPITTTNAAGEVVTNQYDARGNLTSVTNALDQTHRFEYDPNSNMVREYRPMGEVQVYGYNANNSLISLADYLGNRTAYGYDADGRMVRQTNTQLGATVAERVVNYTLDKSGLPKLVADAKSSVSYAYDALARLSEQITVFNTGGLPIAKTLRNSYYANGQLKSRTDAEGINTVFSYDGAGKFKQLNIEGVGAISVATFEGNLPKSMNYPGGLTREYNYDGLSRLSNILVSDNAGNAKMDYGYTYDKVGNITERTTGQGTYRYQYDRVHRLINAEQPSVFGDQAYQYDLNGSRRDQVNSQGTQNYVYNNNNELTAIQKVLGAVNTSTSMSYDANGALISETASETVSESTVSTDTTNYQYNSYGRLNKVDKNNNEIARYQYDPQGRRLSKTVAGDTTYFLYDDTGVGLVGEYDASGNLIRGYSYHVNSHFSTNPVTQKVPKAGGGYEFDFYQNDHLGTPQLLMASSGATTWQGEYDAFGNAHVVASSKVNPLRFAGQYFDQETGQHQNWNRYYDPKLGRYGRTDPIGLAGGINTFGYVGGNPLSRFDPSGLFVPAIVYGCAANPVCASGVLALGGAITNALLGNPIGNAIAEMCMAEDINDEFEDGPQVPFIVEGPYTPVSFGTPPGGDPEEPEDPKRGQAENEVNSGEAGRIARNKGYKEVKGLRSDGQKVYHNPKGHPKYITRSRTSHRGDTFKGYDNKRAIRLDNRNGSYDVDLRRVGD